MIEVSAEFAAGAIAGGFATLSTWQLSTSSRLHELFGRFDEHVKHDEQRNLYRGDHK